MLPTGLWQEAFKSWLSCKPERILRAHTRAQFSRASLLHELKVTWCNVDFHTHLAVSRVTMLRKGKDMAFFSEQNGYGQSGQPPHKHILP